MLEIADEGGRPAESQHEFAPFERQIRVAVQLIAVMAGIPLEREGRSGHGVARRLGGAHGRVGLRPAEARRLREGRDPIGSRAGGGEQVVQQAIGEGCHQIGLRISEDDDAELLGGHERDLRRHAREPAGVRYELASLIVAQPPPQAVLGEARPQRGERRGRVRDRQNRLAGPHLARLPLAEQATSGVPSRVESADQPLREIGHVGRDAACGRDVLHGVDGNALEPPVLDGVGRGRVRARREDRGRRAGFAHAERYKDALAHEVVPAHASGGRGARDQLARHDIEHIVVGVLAAEARDRPREADAVRDLGTAVVGVEPEQVARAQSQAAAVRHQVADREFPGDVRVVQLEPRKQPRHRIVPGELALVRQHGERRGGEGLGVGPDLKERMCVHRAFIAERAHTVPAREEHLAIPHDGDGRARCLEGLERPGHVGVEVLWTKLGHGGRRGNERHTQNGGDSHGGPVAFLLFPD